jgi:hypothetical protein
MSEKIESTFMLRYSVKTGIRATPAAIWARLTDAKGFPTWNSTVQSIEGTIAQGERLSIRVPIAPGRTFRPAVVELVPEQRMTWRDGFAPMFQGARTFTLTPRGEITDFEMVEVLRGVMLPLIKRSLPDFRPVFDRYAADLKNVCERG